MENPPLRAATFDAAGTLIHVAEPVGETYSRLARDCGIALAPASLENAFQAALASAPSLEVRAAARRAEREDAEREWWRDVVHRTVVAAGGANTPRAAEARFFAAAFAHYASPRAWRASPDAHAALALLRQAGLSLAVLSTFDSRLHDVLIGLELRELVDHVLLPSEIGASKPDAEVFARAQARLGAAAAGACVHVGDSLHDDALGALRAGWRAIWLVNDDPHPPQEETVSQTPSEVARVASLAEAAALILAWSR